MSDQEAAIFAYATENGRLSLTDIRALTNCTQTQAKAIAARLVQQVLLVDIAESIFELAPVMQKRFGHAGMDKTSSSFHQKAYNKPFSISLSKRSNFTWGLRFDQLTNKCKCFNETHY